MAKVYLVVGEVTRISGRREAAVGGRFEDRGGSAEEGWFAKGRAAIEFSGDWVHSVRGVWLGSCEWCALCAEAASLRRCEWVSPAPVQNLP